MAFSKEQIARYSRQLVLPELGVRGQERLRAASILIIGAGGLGCPAALYLAAAGVGRLGLVDHETVALGNLHRQVLHTTDAVGRAKVDSAAERLRALNPDVDVIPLRTRVGADTARTLLADYDLVLDGSDNFPTRYLVNDACVLLGKPLVYGGVVHFGGQLMTVRPRQSACFRCVFPEPPEPGEIPRCQDAGVVGTVAGIIGTLMAHEALKLLWGVGELLTDRLLVLDGRAGHVREVPLRRDHACAVCGDEPTIRELQDGHEVPDTFNRCQALPNKEERWRGGR